MMNIFNFASKAEDSIFLERSGSLKKLFEIFLFRVLNIPIHSAHQ